MHRRNVFRDEVVSELMPPLEPDGTSLLWEALGRRFTGLTYQEADRLSQENKEFIRTLFPQDPIYATLLPPHVQELIGQVGPGDARRRKDAAARSGFTYAHRIDPFDGGPHFHARTDDITLVRDDAGARVASAAAARPRPGSGRCWSRASRARRRFSRPCAWSGLTAAGRRVRPLALPDEARRTLEVAGGDEVTYRRVWSTGLNPVSGSRLAMPSTVFIVDDEKNIRRTLRMVLEGEGFAVEEASSGEEALARVCRTWTPTSCCSTSSSRASRASRRSSGLRPSSSSSRRPRSS